MTFHSILKKASLGFSLLSIMAGILFYDTRLYFYGEGIQSENEISFGLIDFLNLEAASFYEIKTSVICIITSALFLFCLFIVKLLDQKDSINLSLLSIILGSSIFLIVLTCFHYNSFRDLPQQSQNYSFQFLPFIDELFSSHFQIRIKIEIITAYFFFFTIIMNSILLFILTCRIAFRQKKHISPHTIIDHLVQSYSSK